jgi:hypothetical protein
MNRLPQVLQNEIWEYVRGDRAFWKTRHQAIINEFFPAFRDEPRDKIVFVSRLLASEKSFGVCPGVERLTVIYLRNGAEVTITPPHHRDDWNWGISWTNGGCVDQFDKFQDVRCRVLELMRRFQPATKIPRWTSHF